MRHLLNNRFPSEIESGRRRIDLLLPRVRVADGFDLNDPLTVSTNTTLGTSPEGAWNYRCLCLAERQARSQSDRTTEGGGNCLRQTAELAGM